MKAKKKYPNNNINFTVILLFLFFALLPPTLVNASQESISITGKITNFKNKKLIVRYLDDNLANITKEHSVSINEKGEFEAKFDFQYGKLLTVYYNSQIIHWFVEPGDRLTISLEATDLLASAHYTGSGKNNNTFLKGFETKFSFPDNYYNYYNQDDQFAFNGFGFDELLLMNPQKFLAKTNTRSSEEVYYYRRQSALNNTTEALNKYMTNYIDYKWAAYKLAYARHQYTVQEIPINYFDFLKNIKLENVAALQHPAYLMFVEEYTKMLHRKNYNITWEGSLKDFASMVETIQDNLGQEVREFCTARMLLTFMDEDNIALIKPYYDDFITSMTKEVYREKVFERYQTLSSLIETQKLPSVVLKNENGDAVDLSSYEGTIVYITFWASWCNSCINEMTAGRISHRLLSNENVVFLFVSLDEDPSQWQRYLKNEKTYGVHLWSDGQNDDLKELFNFSTLPKSIIVNQQGYYSEQIIPSSDRLFTGFIHKLLE